MVTSRMSRPPAAWAKRGMKAQAKQLPLPASRVRRESDGASHSMGLPPLKLGRHQRQGDTLLPRFGTRDGLTGFG